MITPLIAAIDHAPVLTLLGHWLIFAYGLSLVVYGAAALTRSDTDPTPRSTEEAMMPLEYCSSSRRAYAHDPQDPRQAAACTR